MDLNDIELSTEIISQLYKNHLIEEPYDEGSPQKNHSEQKQLDFIGENHKHIVVVVDHPGKNLPKSSLDFLNNLLSASQLKPEDIAILNKTNNPHLSYNHLIEELHSKIILLFGVEPRSLNLPISFPHFQVQPFNGVTHLFSPSLEELADDKILKSKLWVCLKRIFNL